MPGPVVIVEYDPEWPLRFEATRCAIMEAVGSLLVSIEHVGSTAVPGLAGKPVIDIMPGLSRFEHGHACVKPLESVGYEYRGENGIPGRHYFNHYEGDRTQHVHMVVVGSVFWTRQILFRDYLRTHPRVGQEYARLMYSLAERYRTERVAYTEAKADLIEGVLQRANSLVDGTSDSYSG